MHESTKRFSYPYIVWISIIIVIPMILIFFYSVIESSNNQMAFRFTLENYQTVLEPLYLRVLWHSFIIAFSSTVICLIIGYPVAWIISRFSVKKQSTLLILFIMPMWINMLLRTYAWITILERNGVLNSFLALFNLGPLDLMYTDFAVILGMVYNFLPFMILPIYTAILKVDQSLIDAARDLGASDKKVFTRVMLPLTIPGIITGITMVFLPAMSTFVIPQLLGGGQYMMIGNLIERQFLLTGNWYLGSAFSMILMVFILISIWIMKKFDSDDVTQKGKGVFPK